MDPKIVREAKEIPGKLRDIVTSMFEESKPALRTGVDELRQVLSRIEGYLEEVEREHLGSSSKATSTTRRKSGPKRARKSGNFGISKFVLKTLAASQSPLKPAAIVAKLNKENVGHTNPSGTVNNCLARLKKEGKVKRGEGGWVIAPPPEAGT